MPHVHLYFTDAALEAVDEEILDAFFALLPGRETVRSQIPGAGHTVITMDMPDAPPGAAVMVPWITKHYDGTITLASIEYLNVVGQRIDQDHP